MVIFDIGGFLPILLIFAITIYSIVIVMRSFFYFRKASFLIWKPTLCGKIAVALSGIAAIQGIVLILILKGFPEDKGMSFFTVLFPLLLLCATGGIIIGSKNASQNMWNFLGVAIGMCVVMFVSIWLLTPVIFAK